MKKLSLSLCRPNLSHILRGFQIVQIEKKYHALILFDAMFPETGKGFRWSRTVTTAIVVLENNFLIIIQLTISQACGA